MGATLFPGAEKFPITAEMRQWADEKVPTLDIEYYHDEFCDHWIGKKKADWVATWRNWMRRTDRGVAPGLYGPDDKRIVRKRPKPVPHQPDLNVVSPESDYWRRHGKLMNEYLGNGMDIYTAREAASEALAKERKAEG